jgi:ribonuclease P protein component
VDQTFKKSERLCHVKVIESLFNRNNKLNKSLSAYPLLMIYQFEEKERLPKVLFSVPKRKFKRAVDRNLLKRRLKEAYRLNKDLISSNQALNVGFIYTGKEILGFEKLQESMQRLLPTIKN